LWGGVEHSVVTTIITSIDGQGNYMKYNARVVHYN